MGLSFSLLFLRVNHSVLSQILSTNYTYNSTVKALVLSAGNQTELGSNEGNTIRGGVKFNHSVLGQNFTSNCTSNQPVEALFLSSGNQTELVILSTCDGDVMQTCTLPEISSVIRKLVRLENLKSFPKNLFEQILYCYCKQTK